MELIEIEKMKMVDIRTVKACDLVNIEHVDINTELPKEERWLDFAQKVKNPFCYICNGIIIKTSFSDTEESLESRLVQLCIAMDGN
ncbi:hypothetical protein HFM87_03660 [Blautia producta]|uniref:DUF6870 family protein n=1 Tax=Enterocloster clostridioformis TaxID=1531 RepID=UPI0015713185|nr:hypothetical protein [Enterocloster clostridioformis]NSG11501.1 hypothetical protein [Blautia producta]NSG15003.1 hypothetical protein [Blautia producta]NSJ75195.1 hypothetical protein [Blautia producta]